MKIEKLNISNRTRNCLKRAGILTTEQLMELDPEVLPYLRGVGDKTLEEIRNIRSQLRSEMKASEKAAEPPDGSYLHGYREGAAAMRSELIRELTARKRELAGTIRAGMAAAIEIAKEVEV